MSKYIKVPHMLLGLLLSVLWVMIGIPIFINNLAVLNVSIKLLVTFLFGIPLATVVFVLLFLRKKFEYIIFSFSFMIGTVLICILIPIILDP
ncbi:hypothetical protein [Paenibacillus sp. KN14-4R]|uniref:hypothetical protein n=1 Tax=Paenibacillus sp. KN14-4R TaxID=3445773 RepID=UPI003FA03CAF